MLEVERVEYSGDYTIHLVFNNGKAGTVDLQQTVYNDNRLIFSRQDVRKQSNFTGRLPRPGV